jgi:dCTP deaminase
MAVDEPTIELVVPDVGFTLYPGVLYLASTVEYTETPHHRPTLDGRSSVGRLGLFVHVTAGYGDRNFSGTWTCEFVVPYPLTIYPFVEIGQLSYVELVGEAQPYTGQYSGQRGPKKSGLHKEFVNTTYVGKPK